MTPAPHPLHALCKPLAGLCLALAALPALADPSLTGSVSFADGLYTYRYVLDDPDLVVYEVLVMINSNMTWGVLDGPPLSRTSPLGWSFDVYYGGYMGTDPPQHQGGSVAYWGWSINQARLPINGVAFSFTTTQAPATDPLDLTYALAGPLAPDGGSIIFYTGQVVAPDLRTAAYDPLVPIPEPSTYALMLLGAGALVAWGRRRPRR